MTRSDDDLDFDFGAFDDGDSSSRPPSRPCPPLAALGIHDDEPFLVGPVTVTVRLDERCAREIRRTVTVTVNHDAVNTRREALLAAVLVLIRDLGGRLR